MTGMKMFKLWMVVLLLGLLPVVSEAQEDINLDTLRDYAECGVDFISVGALTHSVKGLDMSFKAC